MTSFCGYCSRRRRRSTRPARRKRSRTARAERRAVIGSIVRRDYSTGQRASSANGPMIISLCGARPRHRLRTPAHRARASDATGLLARPLEDDRAVAALRSQRGRRRSRAEIAQLLRPKTTGLSAVVLGCPRRLGRRAERADRGGRSARRGCCGRSVELPVVLQDERLQQPRSGKPARARGEGLAQAQAAARCGVRGSDPAGLSRRAARAMPRSRRSVQRIVNRETSAVRRRWPSSFCARVAGWRRGCTVALERPYKGYAGRRDSSSRFRRAAARHDRRAARRGRRRPRTPPPSGWRCGCSGAGRRLQAGEYRFDRPMTPREVVDKIARGDVYLRPITFREGLTIARWRRSSRARASAPRRSSSRPRRRPTPIRELDPQARTSRAICFPTPTRCRAARPPTQLVARMVVALREGVDAGDARSRPRRAGLSVRELVTLASLVEKETGEAGRAAARRGGLCQPAEDRMGLQCDPTVIYALERAGRYDGNLTRDDLQFDSPYNTYRYAGLPPGPIAAPARRRSRPPPVRRTCPTSTSSAATTARTRSRRRSTSTIATCTNGRSSTFGGGSGGEVA